MLISSFCVMRFMLWFFAFRSALFYLFIVSFSCMFHSLYLLHFMKKKKAYTRTYNMCRLDVCDVCVRCSASACISHTHTHTYINHKNPLSEHTRRGKKANHKIVPVVCFICGRFPRVNMSDCSSSYTIY